MYIFEVSYLRLYYRYNYIYITRYVQLTSLRPITDYPDHGKQRKFGLRNSAGSRTLDLSDDSIWFAKPQRLDPEQTAKNEG